MMSPLQENWFYNQLIESKKRGATWRVIGSQTVFSRINESVAYGNVNHLDYDAWYVSYCKKQLSMLTMSVQERLHGKP
jgi:alkaline phosphatase D